AGTSQPRYSKAQTRLPQYGVAVPHSEAAVAVAVVGASARAALPVVSQPPTPLCLRAPAGTQSSVRTSQPQQRPQGCPVGEGSPSSGRYRAESGPIPA